ncbi:MAG: hypothetical protein ACTIJ6_06575 [Leucobacter sp.]
MSEPQPGLPAAIRWKRPVYVVVVVAALTMVMFAWFHTPEVRVASETAEEGYTTARCANAGPSRWKAPLVSRGQELSADANRQSFNQQVLKNDIESLRMNLACGQARDAHTNTLIVTTFAAGLILFFGYTALWTRPTEANSLS